MAAPARTTDDYIERARRHLWVQTQQYNDLLRQGGPLVIESGEGMYLKDSDGRRYIDVMSGLWVVNTGHGRAEIAEVARQQMERLAFANPFQYATEPAIDLATKLAEIAPAGIEKAYFLNSGSEAVEFALRMAKHYHYNKGRQRRFKVISRMGSYHGTTAMALSANAAPYVNKAPYEPLMPGHIHVENTNCAHCPFEKTYPECELFCARHIEDRIRFENPETVAALIAEPISASNGCWVPQEEYWQILRDICDRHDIVLIADEVINGFGRTGKWFGIDNYPVTPDIMTVAKGISSGYAPISGVLVSEKVASQFVGGKEETFSGGITWGANPLACAIALANIGIIEREGLVDNAATVGAYLGEQLQELRSRRPTVADTRGIGMLHVLELKRNPETGEDFREEDRAGERLPELLRERGMLGRAGPSIPVAPPLTTNREDIDSIIEILDQAIEAYEKEIGVG